MTPTEREKLDIEIYLETKNPKYNGCIGDCADFLRHKDSSRVSRLMNPYDARANNIFGEAVDVLQGFNAKHPELAKFILEKMMLAINSFMDCDADKEAKLTEIIEQAAREQLDVNFAVCRKASQEELESEAFQAFERSRIQYETIKSLREQKQEIQTDYFN